MDSPPRPSRLPLLPRLPPRPSSRRTSSLRLLPLDPPTPSPPSLMEPTTPLPPPSCRLPRSTRFPAPRRRSPTGPTTLSPRRPSLLRLPLPLLAPNRLRLLPPPLLRSTALPPTRGMPRPLRPPHRSTGPRRSTRTSSLRCPSLLPWLLPLLLLSPRRMASSPLVDRDEVEDPTWDEAAVDRSGEERDADAEDRSGEDLAVDTREARGGRAEESGSRGLPGREERAVVVDASMVQVKVAEDVVDEDVERDAADVVSLSPSSLRRTGSLTPFDSRRRTSWSTECHR